jgi:hypothetical protein
MPMSPFPAPYPAGSIFILTLHDVLKAEPDFIVFSHEAIRIQYPAGTTTSRRVFHPIRSEYRHFTTRSLQNESHPTSSNQAGYP